MAYRICMEPAATQHGLRNAGQRSLGELERPQLSLHDVRQSGHSSGSWQGAGRHEAGCH